MKSRSPRRPRVPSQQTIANPIRDFEIEDLSYEGDGVARENGKVTFVANALVGEQVKGRLTKETRNLNHAQLIQVLVPSPDRQAPFCEHFDECGGCQLQHLTVSAQRDVKVKWLRNHLRNIETPSEVTRLTSDDFGYRRRARMSVFVKQGNVRLGFRSKASKDIVDINQCPVFVESLQQAYSAFRKAFLTSSLAGKIGHVELLQDANGVSILLRQSRSVSDDERLSLNDWAHTNGITLYWQPPEDERLKGDALHHYFVDDVRIHFHPQDFIQVNERINDAMVAQAMEWLKLTKDDVMLDLFCGAGNFSLPLAKRVAQVIAVEALESMVDKGRFNAKQANLENVEFIAADLTQSPPNKIKKAKISKVLLDPPRAGAFEFLPTLVRLKPESILYVSCNASTLARDVEYLVENGFRVTRVCMMDMFPQTTHIETMMLLQK